MFKFLGNLFDSNEKQIERLRRVTSTINLLESKYENMSFSDMRLEMDSYRSKVAELVAKIPETEKQSIRKYTKTQLEKELEKYLTSIMPEVYAMIREVAKRKFDRRHFDVQLMAGIVLAEGKIAEVKTGEGKTQIAWLPLALFGLTKRGAHLVTVNDYLARSHGEYAGHIFSELGFSVGITEPNSSYVFLTQDELEKLDSEKFAEAVKLDVKNPGDTRGLNLKQATKKEAYSCDIVYATNNEIGFDHLKDNMVDKLSELVQKELYFCIVDEVDSILIDEARTPLIISMPSSKNNQMYMQFANLVESLDSKYVVLDEKHRSVNLTDEGAEKIENALGIQNLWEDYHMAHHLDNALKAKYLFKKDDEYMVKNGEILIVDEFTGRVLPGRRYSEGLHQAIEAKEGVEIKQESKTLATITFQNLFRIYKHLSGMTGTALTESEEFFKIYNLEVISIPTNRPNIRQDQTDVVYKNQRAKFVAIATEIEEAHKKGQPVLVGTTSVEKSEYLSQILRTMKIPHEVLNAKYHEREAQIISLAGQKSAVTIATNMAGRGTDIRLESGVGEVGGLYVIGSERHESRRIDNQLRGRAGRQGDPGKSKFFLALDDEVMRIQGGLIVQNLMNATNVPEDLPIQSGIIGRTVESAQRKVEGNNFDIRENLVKYDDVMNKQREIFYEKRRSLLNLGLEAKFDNNESEIYDPIVSARETLVKDLKSNMREFSKSISTDDAFAKLELIVGIELLQKHFDTEEIKNKLDKMHELEIQNYLTEMFDKLIDSRYKESGTKFLENIYRVQLQTMDELWMEHLEAMQDLRSGIGLNAYAQRDPLVEYKNKGYTLFENFMQETKYQIASRVFRVQNIQNAQEIDLTNLLTNAGQFEELLNSLGVDQKDLENLQNNTKGQNSSLVSNVEVISKPNTKELDPKFQNVGRNDPCPCGSGKKFKKCHGAEV